MYIYCELQLIEAHQISLCVCINQVNSKVGTTVQRNESMHLRDFGEIEFSVSELQKEASLQSFSCG